MTWTRELPAETGFYWARFERLAGPTVLLQIDPQGDGSGLVQCISSANPAVDSWAHWVECGWVRWHAPVLPPDEREDDEGWWGALKRRALLTPP